MTAGKTLLLLLSCYILFSCQEQEKQASLPIIEKQVVKPFITNYFLKADSLFLNDQYDSASTVYLNISENLAGRNLLYAINRAARAQIYLQKYEEALSTLRKAKNILAQTSSTDSLLADHYYNYGLAFNYLNEGDSSKKYHAQALKIRENILESPDLQLAESYIGLGNVYTYSFYNYTEGQEYYEKALSEIHHLNDSSNNEILLRCYYNLANNYKTLRNLDKAEYYANGALKLAIEKNIFPFQRYCHNLMAIIYQHMGNHESSLSHFQEVLNLLKNESRTDYYFTGVTYLNLALNHFSTGDYDESKAWINKALNLFQERRLTNNAHYGILLVNNGWVKFRSSQDLSDLSDTFRGIEILKGLANEKEKLVNAYAILSQCYLSKQKFQEGIDFLEKGINVLRSDQENSANPFFFNNYRAYELFYSLADAQFEQYKQSGNDLKLISKALTNYLKSDSVLSVVKSKNLLESDELDLTIKSQKNTKNAIQCVKLLAENNNDDELKEAALKVVEQNKSQILYKAIKKAEYQNTAGVPDSLVQKWRDINQQINYLQGEPNNDRAKERLLDLTNELELLNSFLNKNYPNYLKYSSGMNSDFELQVLKNYAKEENAVIINYYYDDEDIMVVSIDPVSANLYFVANDSIFQKALNEYNHVFKKPNPTSKKEYDEFTQCAYFLFNKLVGPALKSRPEGIDRLIIIPDKQLATIPFEAFIRDNTTASNVNYKNLNYLLKEFEINYHHSLSFLTQSKGSEKLKDPYFGGWAYTDLNHEDDRLSKLPHSVEEIDMVSDEFNRELYKEDSATESSFQKNSNKFDIIHLSIHGSSSIREEPCLFFNADSTNDGIIYASELYNLKSKSKLIVLSSCESGLGKVVPGEGVMSIARGFFYIGCPSTLISLSSITDRSSTMIQKDFYQYLKKGQRKSKSLQLSKIDYLENSDKYTSHPSNWAPPVLMGSSEALLKPSKNVILIITIIAALVIAAIIVIRFFLRTPAGK